GGPGARRWPHWGVCAWACPRGRKPHPGKEPPANLTTAGLSKSKDDVQEEQKRLQERARTVRVEIDSSRQALDKAHKELLQAEAEHALAARKHGWELHRQDAECQFANQPLEELLACLKELREEEDGLRGTFNLLVLRFRVREADAARLRKEFAALKAPPVRAPAVSRAEDVDQAVKTTQTRIEHGRQRLDRLQQLRTALDKLVE